MRSFVMAGSHHYRLIFRTRTRASELLFLFLFYFFCHFVKRPFLKLNFGYLTIFVLFKNCFYFLNLVFSLKIGIVLCVLTKKL